MEPINVDKWDAGRYSTSEKAPNRELSADSKLGREPTSIEKAIDLYFREAQNYTPQDYFKEGYDFLGLAHQSAGPFKIDKPVYVKEDDITHAMYVHSTGGGKGVFTGGKIAEAAFKKQSTIVVDPKSDTFLAMIAKNAYGANFHLVDFPRDFGLDLFGYGDAFMLADRLSEMLSLEDSMDPAVAYYRRIGRTTLRKTLNLFLENKLWAQKKNDFIHFSTFLRALKADLNSARKFSEELDRAKPRIELLDKYKKRHFDPKELSKVYFDAEIIRTINDLDMALSEISEGANWKQSINLGDILYSDKPTCLYIRFPALSIPGRKMMKLVISELIQRVLKKKTARPVLVVTDEISLYASEGMTTALSLVRDGGLKFLLLFQDLAQLPPAIKNPIISNCNVKLFGKQSTKEDLEYLQLVGGKEYVTAFGNMGNAQTLRQQTEDNLNVTRQRAYPKNRVMTAIIEAFPMGLAVYSSPIKVESRFDFSTYDQIPVQPEEVRLDKKFEESYSIEDDVQNTPKILENEEEL